MTTSFLAPYTRTSPSGARRHALLVCNVATAEHALAAIEAELGSRRSPILYGEEAPSSATVAFESPMPCPGLDAAIAWMGENAPDGELAVVEP